jgi:hypothetical protein
MNSKPPDRLDGSGQSDAPEARWRALFDKLVEENRRSDEKDYAVCRRLAPKLTKLTKGKPWTPQYIHLVFRSKVKPSPRFMSAVEALSVQPKEGRVTLQLSVPFESREEMEFVRQFLPPWKRRRILLRAIGKRPKPAK